MKKFYVIGSPIEHSLSPQIHQAFAAEAGIALDYQKLRVEPIDLVKELSALQQQGVAGLNITVPLKELVFESIAAEFSESARAAKAVNTIAFHSNNKIYADNTDGAGLVNDLLTHHKFTLKKKKILLLGAGGAARGVIQPLLRQQPTELAIFNRTVARAQRLIAEFNSPNFCLHKPEFKATFDLIINATSASLDGELPILPKFAMTKNSLAYDMVFGQGETKFMCYARRLGAKTSDGVGMLIEQAALGFKLWHGCAPSVQLKSELRRKLS